MPEEEHDLELVGRRWACMPTEGMSASSCPRAEEADEAVDEEVEGGATSGKLARKRDMRSHWLVVNQGDAGAGWSAWEGRTCGEARRQARASAAIAAMDLGAEPPRRPRFRTTRWRVAVRAGRSS